MINYITFPTTNVNLNDFVLTTSYINGMIEVASSDNTIIKLNNSEVEASLEHTNSASLQAEFISNIKKALIAKPGVGRVQVKLPEGFEVTFIEFA